VKSAFSYALCVAVALALGASGVRADDRGGVVRSTATVEVIDNAREVEDIIARVRAKEQAEPRAPEPRETEARAHAPRPKPLPPRTEAAPPDAKGSLKRDRRTERERPLSHGSRR
jgi:hypothetical protein